jgi:hypothetical protein
MRFGILSALHPRADSQWPPRPKSAGTFQRIQRLTITGTVKFDQPSPTNRSTSLKSADFTVKSYNVTAKVINNASDQMKRPDFHFQPSSCIESIAVN